MKIQLKEIIIDDFTTHLGDKLQLKLTYEVFGAALYSAPIILINHALTGNSHVSGSHGWWSALVGENLTIDTKKFTVISFNIPGNGFDGFLVENYEKWTVRDIANAFISGLEKLKIHKLHSIIGGSIGGSIGWEMLAMAPEIADIFVPVATDYKSTDWLNSQCLVQKFLLESDVKPLEKARIHAMLCYRTPMSINKRFKREISNNQKLKSYEWLDYHGRSLEKRYSLKSYRLMNHLLTTIEVSEEHLKNIKSEIHLIAVDTDLFYPAYEILETYQFLTDHKKKAYYHEVSSIHGHDAFLIEYSQMETIFNLIFKEID